MDIKIEHSIKAALAGYKIGASKLDATFELDSLSKSFYTEITNILKTDKQFKEKLFLIDSAFDNNPKFEDLRELFFDFLLINFFQSDAEKLGEDYLESNEWAKIEDETIDRGTELLNLFLYLQECENEDIEPELGDFLKEFLLIEEEEFQEEVDIYKDIIDNQTLVDADFKEISKVGSKLDIESEIRTEFYAIMCFFNEPNPQFEDIKEFLNSSQNKTVDTAILFSLLAFNKGLKSIPVKIN